MWMRPALLTLILLSSLGTDFCCLPATGHWARWTLIQSCDVLACFWIRIPAGRDPAASPDHHLSPGETRAARRRQCFFAALHVLDFCAKPRTANVCFMHMQKGHRRCLKKKKKRTWLTWLRSSRKFVAELQIKSRHFAFWACVFTTTRFFLWASGLVVLSGRSAQHVSLKGKSAGKATL